MNSTQLANIEDLCKALYESTSEAERSHAQQSILMLQSSAEYIPQCQHILDYSSSSYALLVAANSLTKLISTHWNNFTSPQRLDIRNYVLGYLAQKGPSLDTFVCTSLIQMVCRLTKLGWFDDPQHREITQEVTKFLQATVDHCIIGLRILNELVSEMNRPIPSETLTTHRKTAVSFREIALFQIFQVSLTTLRQIQMQNIVGATPEQESKMAEQAVSLAIACLSFDFIGTNPDESSEDVGALQIPTSWRSLIQEPATMQLLFHHYYNQETPTSSKCLECLMLLASVRRSLFAPDKERAIFLSSLITGIRGILKSNVGLSDPENYHEFCRLLGRLKSNYQLSELVQTEGYQEWMEMATSFTVESFKQWEWSVNSAHYILGLWARLVAAVPYVKPTMGASGTLLDTCIPRVFQAFVQSRLDSVKQCCADSALENPLDDEGSLQEQLDNLPTICRYQYKSMGEYLISLLDPLIQAYSDACTSSNDAMNGDGMQDNLAVYEGQLAWLIFIVGSSIGGHTYAASQMKEGDELVDADLSRRVFRVITIVEQRMIQSGGQLQYDVNLELALIYYLHHFRRSYIGEQHGMPATSSPTLEVTNVSSKHKAYQRMFDRMAMGDHIAVVNKIVTKIGNNLKFWGEDEDIVNKTLDLFMDIASGYSSGKLLLGLDTIQYLLANHTADEFPFLNIAANTRHRTTFYATLSRLLFTGADDTSERHQYFMKPFEDMLGHLMQTQNYKPENVRQAIIGVCRDLRGLTMSTHNRKTYSSLFDTLYPTYFPVFTRMAEELFSDPRVTTALLKFVFEFSYNKGQRVMFDQSSPNGILLFREISKIVVAYGSRILNHPIRDDPYVERYKGISICLGILSRALGGNYVNFGVFKLYLDPALDNALEISLQLALSVPTEELMAYPKLKTAYFLYLEILFRNHLYAVLSLETPIFFQLITSLHDGLNSYDLAIAAQCAAAVDHLATFFFDNLKTKDSPSKQALHRHLQARPTIFSTLLSSLFNILIYGESTTQWALSRPILSLTLCSDDALNSYKSTIISTQSVENQNRVVETFTKLFEGIHPNLDPANRDKFTQKLGQFRATIRSFLTVQ